MKTKPLIMLSSTIVFLAIMIACLQESPDDLSKEQKKWIENTLMSMSMEQKVGQLLAPAIAPPRDDSDLDPFDSVKEWINKYHIGHVYLASNRMDPVGTGRFINSIQAETNIPMLIHSDLETGPGSRFDGGTILPPMMGLAQTRSELLAYNAAAITAKEARAIGIHLINSPVLDVNINSNNPGICIRSFGDNPGLVTKLGKAYVNGLNDHGLIGAAKHFPGLGDVTIDSHSKMPTINANRERLDSIEFYPYREIISSGLLSIMTAHISVPVLDPTPTLPATMSKPILNGLLRGELGFNGLIITDAFDMGGILESGPFEELAVQSILASNDIVLLWTNPRFESVFPYVLNAVKEERISQAHLDASVRRILIAKARMGLHKETIIDLEKIPQTVDAPEHRDMAMEIYNRSIVLVKNNGDILPIPPNGKKVALLSVNDDEGHLSISNTFVREMTQKRNVVFNVFLDPTSSREEIHTSLKIAWEADVIVVALFARIFARRGSSSMMNDQLIKLLQDLSIGKKPVFVVSFGSPYLIADFPEVEGYMISTEPTWDFYGYDKYRPGQIAAAKALCGELDINGKLAVSIPELFRFGHGLDYTMSH